MVLQNEAVKILLPEELKSGCRIRSIGLSSLADEGLKVLNRAAEDAVKEGLIFVDAVTKMSFADAEES
jgi:hypothetical protein